MPKFTLEQDHQIKELYPRASKEEILSLIPYTWNSIVRRAALLKVKRDLSFVHTKHRLQTGQSVNDFATEHSIPLSTANQLFNKLGEEYLVDYAKDPHINRLELRMLKLLEDDVQIERWNKFPLEGDIPFRPDFRLTHNNRILYLNIDGIYYHTEDRVGRDYHFQLRQAFEKANLRLLQFRSEELDDSEEIVKSIVLNYFNIGSKLRASACVIRTIPNDVSKTFLNNNHLMKHTLPRPSIGLYHKDELVCLLSYSMHGRVLEIDRFCTKLSTRVYGGFSKLLKHLISSEHPALISSFCDLRYSTGESYKSLGFELKSTSLSWRWASKIRTFSRLSCRANMDERKLSQEQYAKELGYKKIYDAGQAKYVLVLDEKYISSSSQEEDSFVNPHTTRKIFWTKRQSDELKNLFNQGKTRANIVEEFQKHYPDKTENSIIRKLSSLKLTTDRRNNVEVGSKYGYWTVIECLGGQEIRCKCVCGVEKLQMKTRITKGLSKSCGCKGIELGKQTCLEKYGVERASKLAEVKEKINQTNLERYGEIRFSKVKDHKRLV